MHTRLILAVTACLMAAALGGIPNRIAASATDFIRLRPEEIHWQDIPGGHGAQLVTLAGDPSGNGLYIQRVRFPPHVMDRPHWHPNDRHVTVLSGTWFTGTGGTFDPSKADGSNSDEPVIVQIVGIGPAETTQADPSQPFWVQLPP